MKLKFSEPESFMLFYEGLRCVQIFRDMNDPSRLTEASGYLERAIRDYPDDALSHYYLGVVRTLQAQTEPQNQQHSVQAAYIFKRLREEPGLGDLGRRAGIAHDALTRTSSTAGSSQPRKPSGLLATLRLYYDAAAQRVSKSAKDARATELQAKIADVNVRVRRASGVDVPPHERTTEAESMREADLRREIEDLRRQLRAAVMPDSARLDMDADLLNTEGVLCAGRDDAAAAKAFREVLALKPDWLPAKRNLCNVLSRRTGETADELSRLQDEVRLVEEQWSAGLKNPTRLPDADLH